jgi:hypothetical protein
MHWKPVVSTAMLAQLLAGCIVVPGYEGDGRDGHHEHQEHERHNEYRR